jgi:sugar phosphate isomerase/epimerase
MLQQSPRVLCLASLPRDTLARQIRAAAATGFDGVSIWRQHYLDARAEGLDDTAIRAILDGCRLGAVMAEGITRWPSDVRTDAAAAREAESIFSFAVAVGAHDVCTVLMDGSPWPHQTLVESFRAACEMAAGHGLRLALEFVPWSVIDSLEKARSIVEEAGCDNGGLMIDSWHWARAGSSLQGLADLDPRQVFMLQLNDAPALAAADSMHETMHQRLLPGTGDIRLAELLQALQARGVDCPVAAEVFSDELLQLPLDSAARLLAQSLDALFSPIPAGEMTRRNP